MSPAAKSSDMTQHVGCPCGEWRWRVVDGGLGLHQVNRKCRACQRWWLIVFRGPQLVGIARMHGRDAGSLEQALLEVDGLSRFERRALAESARERAKSHPQNGE